MSGLLPETLDLDSILGGGNQNNNNPNRQHSNGNDLLDFSKDLSKDLFNDGKDLNFDSLVDDLLSSESFSDNSGSASPHSSANDESQNTANSISQNSISSSQNSYSTTRNSNQNCSKIQNQFYKPQSSSANSFIQNSNLSPPHNSHNLSNSNSPQYYSSDRSRYSSGGNYTQQTQQQQPPVQYIQAPSQNFHQEQQHQQPIYQPVSFPAQQIVRQITPTTTISNTACIPKIIQATPVTPSSNIILLDSAQTIKAQPGQTIQIRNSDGTFEKITVPNLQNPTVSTVFTPPVNQTVIQIPDSDANPKRARYSTENSKYKVITIDETKQFKKDLITESEKLSKNHFLKRS